MSGESVPRRDGAARKYVRSIGSREDRGGRAGKERGVGRERAAPRPLGGSWSGPRMRGARNGRPAIWIVPGASWIADDPRGEDPEGQRERPTSRAARLRMAPAPPGPAHRPFATRHREHTPLRTSRRAGPPRQPARRGVHRRFVDGRGRHPCIHPAQTSRRACGRGVNARDAGGPDDSSSKPPAWRGASGGEGADEESRRGPGRRVEAGGRPSGARPEVAGPRPESSPAGPDQASFRRRAGFVGSVETKKSDVPTGVR